jgi:hypothetical protein
LSVEGCQLTVIRVDELAVAVTFGGTVGACVSGAGAGDGVGEGTGAGAGVGTGVLEPVDPSPPPQAQSNTVALTNKQDNRVLNDYSNRIWGKEPVSERNCVGSHGRRRAGIADAGREEDTWHAPDESKD